MNGNLIVSANPEQRDYRTYDANQNQTGTNINGYIIVPADSDIRTAIDLGRAATGVGDWVSYVANFQNGWQETSETDHYNDGTRAEVTYDTAAQAWDYTANWYDAANRLTAQDTIYDNGTATETGYNVTGMGDWTTYTATFDAGKGESASRGAPFLKEAVPKIELDDAAPRRRRRNRRLLCKMKRAA